MPFVCSGSVTPLRASKSVSRFHGDEINALRFPAPRFVQVSPPRETGVDVHAVEQVPTADWR